MNVTLTSGASLTACGNSEYDIFNQGMGQFLPESSPGYILAGLTCNACPPGIPCSMKDKLTDGEMCSKEKLDFNVTKFLDDKYHQ